MSDSRRPHGQTNKMYARIKESENRELRQEIEILRAEKGLVSSEESRRILNLKRDMIQLIDEIYNAEINLTPNFNLRNKLSEMKVKLMYG